MLDVIGVVDIEALFQQIPTALRSEISTEIPSGLSEIALSQVMQKHAQQDSGGICFMGAGAYQHHIPAVIQQLAKQDDFFYQTEAHQGQLQLGYEYQLMMGELLAMEMSNELMDDGATALAQAILIAIQINTQSTSKKILIPRTLDPQYRKTLQTLLQYQPIELIELPFDLKTGRTDITALAEYKADDICALVINQPNFFGVIEDVDSLTAWTQNRSTMAIGVVNPLAMAILKPAGEWAGQGVDLCVGNGQPLGLPVSESTGFIGYRPALAKQVTLSKVHINEKGAFDLKNTTIQNTHLKSMCCTTFYLALMGAKGLYETAVQCHVKIQQLVQNLSTLSGIQIPFKETPHFHEHLIQLPISAESALKMMAAHNILGGVDISADYPELKNSLLICATECRTEQDMALLSEKLERVLATQMGAACNLRPEGF